MSNELVPANMFNLPSVQQEKGFLDECFSGDYLKRIQFVGKGRYVEKDCCKAGSYVVPKSRDEVEHDFGRQITLVPIAFRPKAMDTSDSDNLVISYDRSSAEFKRIQDAPSGSNCMWGPTFLVFEVSTGEFYELFLCNKSSRKASERLILECLPISPEQAKADGVEPRGPVPASCGSEYIEKKGYTWYAPTFEPSAIVIDNFPPVEKVKDALDKFFDMKGSSIEVAPEKSSGRAR